MMGAEIDTGAAPQMNRRQKAKAATRQKVLNAAQALFEAKAEPGEDSYVKATIRDIASATGMSTGAVFANFKGKADLYCAIYGHPPVSAELGRELLLMSGNLLTALREDTRWSAYRHSVSYRQATALTRVVAKAAGDAA